MTDAAQPVARLVQRTSARLNRLLCVLVLGALCSVTSRDASGGERPVRPPENIGRPESVQFPGAGMTLRGELFLPAADRKGARRPAVVLLHGCGGLYTGRGQLTGRHRDWAVRFATWGFAALLVDSLGPRGVPPLCDLEHRPIHPWKERTLDAYAALDYLVARTDVDPGAVFVMGWSHGGSTVMAVAGPDAPGRRGGGPRFKAAIAYYPGCGRPLAQKRYRPTLPLLIQHGEADDWVSASPCVTLAERMKREGVEVEAIIYPEAHHGFDAPGTPLRLLPDVYNPGAPGRRGAHVGTHEPSRLKAIADTRRFVDRHVARYREM